MKILSTTYHHEFPAWTFPDWAVEELKQKFPDTEVVKLTSRERVLDEISNTDILLTWLVRPAEIAAAKKAAMDSYRDVGAWVDFDSRSGQQRSHHHEFEGRARYSYRRTHNGANAAVVAAP